MAVHSRWWSGPRNWSNKNILPWKFQFLLKLTELAAERLQSSFQFRMIKQSVERTISTEQTKRQKVKQEYVWSFRQVDRWNRVKKWEKWVTKHSHLPSSSGYASKTSQSNNLELLSVPVMNISNDDWFQRRSPISTVSSALMLGSVKWSKSSCTTDSIDQALDDQKLFFAILVETSFETGFLARQTQKNVLGPKMEMTHHQIWPITWNGYVAGEVQQTLWDGRVKKMALTTWGQMTTRNTQG